MVYLMPVLNQEPRLAVHWLHISQSHWIQGRRWSSLVNFKSPLMLHQFVKPEKSEMARSPGSLGVDKGQWTKVRKSLLVFSSYQLAAGSCWDLPDDPMRDFPSPPPHQLLSTFSKTSSHLLLLSRLLPQRSRPPPSPPSHPFHCPCCLHRSEWGRRTLKMFKIDLTNAEIYLSLCFIDIKHS